MDQSLKLTDKPIHAGFPNAADEAVLNKLNIHKLLIKRPSSTYFMRLDGSLHASSYNHAETLLIIDRGLEMQFGDLIVVSIRGEMILKTYKKVRGRSWLISVSGTEKHIEITSAEEDIVMWGVVLHVVESLRGLGDEF